MLGGPRSSSRARTGRIATSLVALVLIAATSGCTTGNPDASGPTTTMTTTTTTTTTGEPSSTDPASIAALARRFPRSAVEGTKAWVADFDRAQRQIYFLPRPKTRQDEVDRAGAMLSLDVSTYELAVNTRVSSHFERLGYRPSSVRGAIEAVADAGSMELAVGNLDAPAAIARAERVRGIKSSTLRDRPVAHWAEGAIEPGAEPVGLAGFEGWLGAPTAATLAFSSTREGLDAMLHISRGLSLADAPGMAAIADRLDAAESYAAILALDPAESVATKTHDEPTLVGHPYVAAGAGAVIAHRRRTVVVDLAFSSSAGARAVAPAIERGLRVGHESQTGTAWRKLSPDAAVTVIGALVEVRLPVLPISLDRVLVERLFAVG